MSLLKLEKLTMRFGGLTAVDAVDCAVDKGQIYSIIGPNGAGKTTVFNAITGIYEPTAGKIEFEGKELRRPLHPAVFVVCALIGLATGLTAAVAMMDVDKLWWAAIKRNYVDVDQPFSWRSAWNGARAYWRGDLLVEQAGRRWKVTSADGSQSLGRVKTRDDAEKRRDELQAALTTSDDPELMEVAAHVFGLLAIMIVVSLFCATLNFSIDRIIYKPLRTAPKLAPLVSAIGVSFVLMNVGLLWKDAADLDFPDLVPRDNLFGEHAAIQFTLKDALVIGTIAPLMIALTLFVKFTRMGKAMRATAQDPIASRLMGINVDRVIATTFLIGGALGGAASVIYGLYINTIGFQMGYQNGLYAFTAAVLGGIGSIPGAVLGGLMIGVVRALGSTYGDERWTGALVFVILIITLVFRPAGLLGRRMREKV